MTLTDQQIDKMVASFLATASWTATEEDQSDAEFSEHAKQQARNACCDFLVAAEALLDAIPPAYTDRRDNFENTSTDQLLSNLGHDLFLTRNSHGAGFWCRSSLLDTETPDNPCVSLADTLTTLAGDHADDVYAGDDGLLHFS